MSFAATWTPNRSHERFPNPFLSYSSTTMPENIVDAHRWAEFVVATNGIYTSALKRVISYFLTDITVGDDETGDEEKEKYEEFFNDTLHVKKVLARVAINFLTYGNVFTSLIVPFKRYLVCPECGADHPLRTLAESPSSQFRWTNFEFHAKCHGTKRDGSPCTHHGAWRRADRRTLDKKRMRVKVWNPKFIDIKYEDYSEERGYIWRIPENYKTKIRQGHLHYLEYANWEIIECIRDNRNLEFEPGVLYHLYEDGLAGHELNGHGTSSIWANFRQAWYVALLHSCNEELAVDGIMPLRIVTPAPGKSANPEAADPILNLNAGGMMRRLRKMIREHRLNPTEWYSLPFPVEYQVLGGDATKMTPYELLDQAISVLLNNIGVPVEMYKGTLSLQAAPPALRLFENSWAYLVNGLNECLQTLADQVADALGWEPVRIKLVSPRIVDDIQDHMARLQLMMGRQISQTTGLKPLNIDFREEQRRILEEDRYIQEQQARLAEEMDQAAAMEEMAMPPQAQQMAGQPAPPGQPPGGQPASPAQPGQPAGPAGMADQGMSASMMPTQNARMSPQEMLGKGQEMAEQFMQLPPAQRRARLGQLKHTDESMHAIVTAALDKIRSQMDSAAGDQALQQQYGAGAAGR